MACFVSPCSVHVPSVIQWCWCTCVLSYFPFIPRIMTCQHCFLNLIEKTTLQDAVKGDPEKYHLSLPTFFMRSLNCVECGKAVLQMFWVDTRNFTTVKVWTQHLLKYFMWLHIWYRFLAVLYCLFWMVMSLSRCTICKLRILIHCRNKTVGYPDKFSSYELWDNYLRQRRRYMFARVHLSVCLSVSKITEKRVHGFGWNLACRQMSGRGRTD